MQDGPLDVNGVKRKILVAEQDFEAGDVIYKVYRPGRLFPRSADILCIQEEPLVAVLDSDLQGKGTHCSYCLRHIQKGMAIKPESDRLNSVYCSKDCQLKDKVQAQNLLFSTEPYLPPELDGGIVSAQTTEKREKAQEALASFITSKGKAIPLMAARFVARQVALETSKMVPGGHATLAELPKFMEEETEYGLYDHVERLRFVEPKIDDNEIKLLRDVLGAALPGLETALQEEQYGLFSGKMMYNAFGVCYGGGRDDKVCSFCYGIISNWFTFESSASLNRTTRRPGTYTNTLRNISTSWKRVLRSIILCEYLFLVSS